MTKARTCFKYQIMTSKQDSCFEHQIVAQLFGFTQQSEILVHNRRKIQAGNVETNNNVITHKNVQESTDTNIRIPKQPKSLTRSEVAKVMWEPGILSGYRATNQPWTFYLRSLFWIHNETANIWTHLLAPVLSISLVYSFRKDIDFSTNISSHGLLVFTITSTISFLSSALAHLFHSKNELVHYIVFSLDYIGIALYGYGYGIMVYYCSGNELFYNTMGNFFPIIHALLASNITICGIIARTKYRNKQCLPRKYLQVFSAGSSVIFCQLVVMFRMYETSGITITHSYHMYQLFLSFTNGLLFSMHQPERAYPGKFDIWGHGHQWFHLSVICCALSQLLACHEDLLFMRKSVLNMAQANVVTIWGSLLAFILINVSILLLFYPKLKHLAKRD